MTAFINGTIQIPTVDQTYRSQEKRAARYGEVCCHDRDVLQMRVSNREGSARSAGFEWGLAFTGRSRQLGRKHKKFSGRKFGAPSRDSTITVVLA